MSWGDSPVRALAQAFNTEREWAERLAAALEDVLRWDGPEGEDALHSAGTLLFEYRAYRTGMDNGRAG